MSFRGYFVGTSGYHYRHWRERFYPRSLPAREWLAYYAERFTTVELNNPFYRLPSEAAFRAWREQTPPGFRFAVKASRFITHLKRLRDAQAPVATFMQRARLLGEKLGPVLYQLPPSLQRDDQRLRDFLAVLPAGVEHVIEFRHSSWFDESALDLLRERGVGFCVADHPTAPAPFAITASFAYLRFHGSQGAYQGSYGDEDLRVWASRLRLVAPRLKAVYAYFNNDAYAAAVGDARRLRAMLES